MDTERIATLADRIAFELAGEDHDECVYALISVLSAVIHSRLSCDQKRKLFLNRLIEKIDETCIALDADFQSDGHKNSANKFRQ